MSDQPRTLADAIRGMDERQLVTLLLARPDLAQPRPSSLGELVERAGSPTSAGLAVDRLDTWQRAVAEALATCTEPTTARALAGALDADQSAVQSALDTLLAWALAWSPNSRTGSVLLTRSAAMAFGPYPAGLAPPSPAPLSTIAIDQALAEADREQHEVLHRLMWQPVGRLRNAQRPITTANAVTASERLVAARLLRPVADDAVVLAREVAMRLREGRLFPEPVAPQPPALPAAQPDRVQANAALGTAVEALETFTTIVEQLALLTPKVLSTGGLGRRDLKTLSVGADEDTAALMLALARQAGMIASHGPRWLATPAFDRWAEQDPWHQWRDLVRAWAHLDRWPSASSDPLLPAGQRSIVGMRRAVLAEWRRAPAGTAMDPDLLAARVGWRQPSWPAEQTSHAARQLSAEAAALGALALGRTSQLLEATDDPGFPPPTHQFVVQADLSATPVGPLQVAVRRRLDQLTDRGPDGRRFTPASIRRGLDTGLGSEQIVDWLTAHSMTPLPQPLTYLIADVARQHGQIRVMPAAAIITIEDPALLESLLRSPEASVLGLTKVGPQAVAAQGDVVEVVEVLQGLGQAPVAQSAEGQVMQAPRPLRATHAPSPPTEPGPPTRDQVTVLARQLLLPDPVAAADDLVAALQSAQRSGDWVHVTHVDDQGRPRTDTARILGVAAGHVRLVRRASPPVTLPLARVVSMVTD
ncbi:helicase-associated domain-containing protein [Propionibacteriaceae bacterium Y1923]|uniref:helicase-associated domain-containing protein n=1 Tax=Aestuariimicrobium sp. Y1814 TaxID=3418742 RepID=UPI003C1F1F3B